MGGAPKMWSEQAIRECLDGTFTRVAYDGEVITQQVDEDYRPYHKNFDQGRSRGSGDNEYQRWTESEDALLVALRQDGRSFDVICQILKRPIDGVKRRYRIIKRAGK